MTLKRFGMAMTIVAAVVALGTVGLWAHGLNGTWDLDSKGGPHGDMTFQVTFTHGEGTALTARMTIFDSKIDMSGEAKDGAFSVSGDNKGSKLSLSGKLKADGTLEGYLSNEQGDLRFTGARAK